MKRIIVVLVLFIFCYSNAFAHFYKQAKNPGNEGFYDNVLQEDIYEVSYTGVFGRLFSAKSCCMLRSAEVCLENGYKTFDIIFNESLVCSVDITGIYFNIRCYKDDTGIYKASQIKTNLYKLFNIKKEVK